MISPEVNGQSNISITNCVPDAVPSLTNSSLVKSGTPAFCTGLLKNSLESPATNSTMSESIFGQVGHIGGDKSITIEVPPTVPSVFQSSLPWTPSSAVKYRFPPISTIFEIRGLLFAEPILATCPIASEQSPKIIDTSDPWRIPSSGIPGPSPSSKPTLILGVGLSNEHP